MRIKWLCMLLMGWLSWLPLAQAELAVPTGEVVLVVKGNLKKTNVGNEAHFDLAMLDQLAQVDMTMKTPWTEEDHRYSGVMLRELLDHLGAWGGEVVAAALNDYQAVLPFKDAFDYDVLLATREDGNVMSRRNKGPIWVLYPLGTRPELNVTAYHNLMVWQVKSLEVR
ncbi:molybdopterin-dependent oxidoreductase [Balneatrix alpica]|uniref:Molybdopterin-dependent oxidoreductase n=1 Tax=Balneatrix alpica TaxID=75684 RepID=A0ABV5ZC78_9GAMM|nr:molybdopterin-dependent oxidoreductase [Balneatrix alpica]